VIGWVQLGPDQAANVDKDNDRSRVTEIHELSLSWCVPEMYSMAQDASIDGQRQWYLRLWWLTSRRVTRFTVTPILLKIFKHREVEQESDSCSRKLYLKDPET
jgi:glucan phosphorylase